MEGPPWQDFPAGLREPRSMPTSGGRVFGELRRHHSAMRRHLRICLGSAEQHQHEAGTLVSLKTDQAHVPVLGLDTDGYDGASPPARNVN
jgi:hypothetical protein